MGCTENDFVLSRAGSRSGSKVLDARMAHALKALSRPARIVDAVLSVSERFGADPEATLDAMLPGLTLLMAEGFVVRADARGLHKRHVLASGSRVGDCAIIACLQAMDDSEVYQVRLRDGAIAALKLACEGSELGHCNILNESLVLERLSGQCIPRMFERGDMDGSPYLIVEWRRGTDAGTVASELRTLPLNHRRQAQLDLCVAIADAYGWLHDKGFVHGDVHEGNLLYDSAGRLTLLDFGLARELADQASNPPRGAAGHAYEPEYARALLDDAEAPSATPAGEQFVVAGLLFDLLTGVSYADFSYEKQRVLTQIVHDAARSFAECGIEPWPEVESVLHKALSKRPEERYSSTSDFAQALRLAGSTTEARLTRANSDRLPADRRLFDAWLDNLASFHGDVSQGVGRPPHASFAYGAAGVAYALLRLARLEDSPKLLAAADVWAEHSMWSTTHDGGDAFGDSQLSSDEVGSASLYFSRPGIHTVRALIGIARGDEPALRRATRALERASEYQSSPFDLALGQPGLLLACALLLEATPATITNALRRLTTLGDRCLASMWEHARSLPQIGSQTDSLGVAHGWAGLIYATLRWNLVTQCDLPNGCSDRVEQLASLAEPIGRGIRFQWWSEGDAASNRVSEPRYMAGWCNGSAGFVHTWLAAAESLRSTTFRDLAELSAWHTWEDDSDDDATLCCGLPGRAYALLAWHRCSGDAIWIARARELVQRSKSALQPDATLDPALLKGQLSLALIERELDQPHLARMPLFEGEGWPRQGTLGRSGRHRT